MEKKSTTISHRKTVHREAHAEQAIAKKERYFEAVGRRKTAIARVRIFAKSHVVRPGSVMVNGKDLAEYFSLPKHQRIVLSAFSELSLKEYGASVKVFGGGVNAQAEAIRLGISRALILINAIWRSKLKALGFLKRDPRIVERKKFGSRKARRPQQWRKR